MNTCFNIMCTLNPFKKSIILIDDDVSDLISLKRIIEKTFVGLRVITYSSATKCSERIARIRARISMKPQMVIIDSCMAGIKGETLSHQFRMACPDSKITMYSSNDPLDEKQKMHEKEIYGYDSTITKSADFTNILNNIRDSLNLS